MLVEPRLNVLMTKADAKYSLVIMSSKRARRIMEEHDSLHENAVSLALWEIARDELTYDFPIPGDEPAE